MMRAALCLLLLLAAGCAPVTGWRDVQTLYDPQAIQHNERVCAERGMVWDAATGGCAP
jgi:hypothetical protein